MKGLNFATTFGKSNLWTCRNCLHYARAGSRVIRQAKQYSTSTIEIPKSKTRGRVILATTGAALGVGAIAFTDDLKHAYHSAERSGRVLSTLAVCINE
jgi:aarF domain-containing kinase